MEELIPDFPREIGVPYRIKVESLQEFIKLVKALNGTKRIFYRLYNLNTNLVDKIFFDCDSCYAYFKVKKLKEYCVQRDLKHMVVFSGGGFHFYIFAKPDPTKPQKELLDRTHRYIAKEVGLTIGSPSIEDVDSAIVGDVARIVTLPGTYNIKRRRWARAIPDYIFAQGEDAIKDYCKPNGSPDGKFRLFIYGEKLFDFEEVKYKHVEARMPSQEKEYKIEIDDEKLQKICPPCVLSMLTEKGCWRSRYYASFYLRELGLPKEKIDEIAKKYFSKFPRTDRFKNNYEHYNRVQGVLRQLFSAVKDSYCYPNCEKMNEYGLCTGRCNWYPLQKKLYK